MRGYRVLIVDDDAVDRQLYCKLLADFGPDNCSIQQAADGAAGLAALRAERFDCVLLDFSLPGMTGLEFLSAVAVDGALPCAFVLITGRGNEAIAVEAMKRGVQDYLAKDQVNANTLVRTVTQAVNQAELRQRLAGSLRELSAANIALQQEIATREAAQTEALAAKEAAERANQAKTRFVAMVTHELRTPLHGISGYAQLLHIEGGLSAKQSAHVAAMMQAVRHLREMIDRVLDFASIEAGRMELQLVRVVVREVVDACIAFISPTAADRALSVRVVHSLDAPRQIVVDPVRLRQLLLNLLSNAVKYTATGGIELRVLGGAASGMLRMEVADTGRGIAEADRELLFRDFERLDDTTSVQGTGLGLAISARLVHLMGGTIGHCPNPGGGSIFWFELPAPEVAPAALAALEPALPGSGKHVLLVDDIKINLDIIRGFLHAAGHTVVLAGSGREAVRLAAEEPFDVILMDVRMADVDGLEATRRIRKLPDARGKVPILALTAYSSLDQVAACLAAGMDGHVPKPVDFTTLMRAIDDVIASTGPAGGQAVGDAGAAEAVFDRPGI